MRAAAALVILVLSLPSAASAQPEELSIRGSVTGVLEARRTA